MKRTHPEHSRLLAVSLSARGFGYAVMEGGTLVDWGVKTTKGIKNAECVKKAEGLIKTFTPEVLVMHDPFAKGSKRGARARQLTEELTTLAKNHALNVALFSREQIRRTFFADREATKQDVAENIARRFPEELGSRLPPKRRPWESENYRMGIFDAVSLALTFESSK
jgi:hypothetical protein